MAKTVYGNAIDLANAKSMLGNDYNYVDTSAGGKYTPGLGDVVVGGTGAVGGLVNAGQGIRLAGADRDATAAAIQGYANQQNYTNSLIKGYTDQINEANNAAAEAQRIARQGALDSAFQNNDQALNSQKSTVTNNFDSLTRQINTTKDAQLPQYQAQKDQASADANTQLRRTQALNALTGKFFSGVNRSQMQGVDLAKQNAIGNIQGAENQFKTQMTNKLTDADAQRVAALNDLAEKIALNQKQHSQGTLDLTNQIESEKAAGASQAMADAMKWAQGIQQQGVDNSLRQAQLDLNQNIFNADQSWKDKTFTADQENAAIERALAIAGVTGIYDGSPTLAKQELDANSAYRNAALARSGGSGGGGSSGGRYYGGATTASQGKDFALSDVYSQIQSWIDAGYSYDQVRNTILSNPSDYAKVGLDPNKVADDAYDIYQASRFANGGHAAM